MRRILAILVFAVAAGASVAASSVVVAPHVDPPGTPPFHSHVLAAYRLPIFLDVLRARFDPHHGLLTQEALFDATATVVLALLVLAWPRLPRPALAAVTELPAARLARALWCAPLILGPPRRVGRI